MDNLWMYCKRAYKEVDKVISKQEQNQIIDKSREVWIERHRLLDQAKDDQERLEIIFAGGITLEQIQFELLNDLYYQKTGKDIPYVNNLRWY